MKVLVTGAAGFIGSHVARLLAARGDAVTAVVRPRRPHPRLDGVDFPDRAEIDLEDPRAVESLLVRAQPEAVVHLAWYADPHDYLVSPKNIASLHLTARLAEQAFAAGCRKLVGVGTCLEYAKTDRPVTERDQTDPRTLYAAAKLGAWLVLRALGRRAGAEVAWARVFHVYGPEEHPARLLPSLLASLRGGQPIDVTAGHQVRDYLHVSDAAAGIVALLAPGVSGPFNVCSGRPRPLRDLLEIVGRLSGRPDLLSLGGRPYSPDEEMYLAGRSDRLRALGWAPQFESLEEGLADIVKAGP